MRIIDITRTLQDAPVYYKDEPTKFELVEDMANGGSCNASVVTAGVHLGTHADAFSHFMPEGTTIDKMPLEHYCGKCRVITVPSDTLVKLSDIKGKLAGSELCGSGPYGYHQARCRGSRATTTIARCAICAKTR